MVSPDDGERAHHQVSADVLVSCRRALVSQPQRDDADVHARVQKVHGRRVANDVRGDAARRKLRLRYGLASAGTMSSPGLVDGTDQALRRAIPSIAVSRLFITGSYA